MLARALAQGIIGRELSEDELRAGPVERKGFSVMIRRTGDYGEDENGNPRKWHGPSVETDVACVFGVKGRSREIVDEHRALGKSTLYFDKGYTRSKGEAGHTEYSRISVNASHPAGYMMKQRWPSDRWERLGIQCKDRQPVGGHVLLAMSSAKYHEFNGLEPPEDYAIKRMKELQKQTKKQLIYRPKPSDKRAKPIPGMALSPSNSTIQDALRGCHCVVTHGATAAMDAIIAGVPAMVLGKCISLPVGEKEVANIENPFFPDKHQRMDWLHAVAYQQWTAGELRAGIAWAHLKAEIERQAKK